MSCSFHYLLMAAHARLQRQLFSAVRGEGLTLGQPKVLDYLADHNGASQKEIAEGCHIEPASLTSLLNRMEEQQMIQRRMLNGNRRTLHVFLTPHGQQLLGIVQEAFAELEERALTGLSPQQREDFLRALQLINQNLNAKESL